MGRLLLSLVLGGAVFAFLAWQLGLITKDDGESTTAPSQAVKRPKPNLGKDLFASAPLKPTGAPPSRKVDPIAVVGTMAVIDRPDVAAQIPGQVMFVGTEIPEGAAQVAGIAAFMAEPFDYTKVNYGEREILKLYRRLFENQIVHEDQMLALVDISKSLGDLDTKRGKTKAAEFDAKGAKAIAKEAENKLRAADQAFSKRAISEEDWRSAGLTKEKMYYDSVAKDEAWNLARIEENVSRIIYKQHEIRNKIPAKTSIIHKIYRQRSEAVKELEPVLQLYRLDRLMAEAQIEQQYRHRLRDGVLVTIEPSMVQEPPKTYFGHVAAVNCLAVTADPKQPLIVSGGEDRTVLVWQRFQQGPIREFKHPEAVRALACSPKGNLLVTGCADGTVRLYDLGVQDKNKVLVKEAKDHTVAVTALAFSPDGKYFVSGAADGAIILWTTDKVESHYVFDEAHGVSDPHHGAVTSLHFTPRCKLVSAGLDNTIRVWSLKEKGAELDYEPLAGRAGSVSQLDVTSDGRWLLFDQGKTLQIRLVEEDGRMVNTLENPGGVIPFETLAVFSPDASLMMTAGAGEGRLQLWRAPTEAARGFEIRQLVPRQRAPVSCAAFAPHPDYDNKGSFAVSANKDGQIFLWPLPSQKEVDEHPIRNVRVRLVNDSLNPSTRQVSIGVEVPNPPTPEYPTGRLEPGRPVTIVIE
jgi:WD40 repeat protein